MPSVDLDINPADFITIGTVGPKGKRVFYLQAGRGSQVVSLVIEKEQSWALSEAIRELIDDLDQRLHDDTKSADYNLEEMDLREPIEPVFRVSQMGLGYDEEQDKVVLVAQELLTDQLGDDDDDDADTDDADDSVVFSISSEENKPGVVRIWCSRPQMRALSEHAMSTVRSGRVDPKQNGRLVYYWT